MKIVFAPGVAHTLPDYLQAKIRQPHAFPSAKMPQYTFAQPQVDALVTALLAQTERARTLPASLRVAGKRESGYRPAGKAGQLMADMNCFSCHAINGRGGNMAPDLTWEGSSVQRHWLVSFMKNPNTLRPALIRRMPRFNVTDAEAETIADYISTGYQIEAEVPVLPYSRAAERQGLHRSNAHASGSAAQRGLDLPLAERSASPAARNIGAQPEHERCGCPRTHGR